MLPLFTTQLYDSSCSFISIGCPFKGESCQTWPVFGSGSSLLSNVQVSRVGSITIVLILNPARSCVILVSRPLSKVHAVRLPGSIIGLPLGGCTALSSAAFVPQLC